MKMGHIKSWKPCEAGNGIVLPGPYRRLQIEIIGAGPFSMLHGTSVYPLGELSGLTTLDVVVEGDVEFYFDGPVLFRTDDQANLGVQDGRYTESYTVMWERGPVQNPEFVRMMKIAELRDQERQRQMDVALAELRKLKEHADAIANGPSATGSAAQAPAAGARPAEPAQPAPVVPAGSADPVAGPAATPAKPAGSAEGNAGSQVPQQPPA